MTRAAPPLETIGHGYVNTVLPACGGIVEEVDDLNAFVELLTKTGVPARSNVLELTQTQIWRSTGEEIDNGYLKGLRESK